MDATHKSAKLKTETRVKNAGMGGNTPIKGAGPHVDMNMKSTRVAKKSEISRKDDPAQKFGHMGLKIGTRVTSREVK